MAGRSGADLKSAWPALKDDDKTGAQERSHAVFHSARKQGEPAFLKSLSRKVHVQSIAQSRVPEVLAEDLVALKEELLRVNSEQRVLLTHKRRLESDLLQTRNLLAKAEEQLRKRHSNLLGNQYAALEALKTTEHSNLVANLKEQNYELKSRCGELEKQMAALMNSSQVHHLMQLQEQLEHLRMETNHQKQLNTTFKERAEKAEHVANQAAEMLKVLQKRGLPDVQGSGAASPGRLRKGLQVVQDAHRVMMSQAQVIRPLIPAGTSLEESRNSTCQGALKGRPISPSKRTTDKAVDILRFLRAHQNLLQTALLGLPGGSSLAEGALGLKQPSSPPKDVVDQSASSSSQAGRMSAGASVNPQGTGDPLRSICPSSRSTRRPMSASSARRPPSAVSRSSADRPSSPEPLDVKQVIKDMSEMMAKIRDSNRLREADMQQLYDVMSTLAKEVGILVGSRPVSASTTPGSTGLREVEWAARPLEGLKRPMSAGGPTKLPPSIQEVPTWHVLPLPATGGRGDFPARPESRMARRTMSQSGDDRSNRSIPVAQNDFLPPIMSAREVDDLSDHEDVTGGCSRVLPAGYPKISAVGDESTFNADYNRMMPQYDGHVHQEKRSEEDYGEDDEFIKADEDAEEDSEEHKTLVVPPALSGLTAPDDRQHHVIHTETSWHNAGHRETPYAPDGAPEGLFECPGDGKEEKSSDDCCEEGEGHDAGITAPGPHTVNDMEVDKGEEVMEEVMSVSREEQLPADLSIVKDDVCFGRPLQGSLAGEGGQNPAFVLSRIMSRDLNDVQEIMMMQASRRASATNSVMASVEGGVAQLAGATSASILERDLRALVDGHGKEELFGMVTVNQEDRQTPTEDDVSKGNQQSLSGTGGIEVQAWGNGCSKQHDIAAGHADEDPHLGADCPEQQGVDGGFPNDPFLSHALTAEDDNQEDHGTWDVADISEGRWEVVDNGEGVHASHLVNHGVPGLLDSPEETNEEATEMDYSDHHVGQQEFPTIMPSGREEETMMEHEDEVHQDDGDDQSMALMGRAAGHEEEACDEVDNCRVQSDVGAAMPETFSTDFIGPAGYAHAPFHHTDNSGGRPSSDISNKSDLPKETSGQWVAGDIVDDEGLQQVEEPTLLPEDQDLYEGDASREPPDPHVHYNSLSEDCLVEPSGEPHDRKAAHALPYLGPEEGELQGEGYPNTKESQELRGLDPSAEEHHEVHLGEPAHELVDPFMDKPDPEGYSVDHTEMAGGGDDSLSTEPMPHRQERHAGKGGGGGDRESYPSNEPDGIINGGEEIPLSGLNAMRHDMEDEAGNGADPVNDDQCSPGDHQEEGPGEAQLPHMTEDVQFQNMAALNLNIGGTFGALDPDGGVVNNMVLGDDEDADDGYSLGTNHVLAETLGEEGLSAAVSPNQHDRVEVNAGPDGDHDLSTEMASQFAKDDLLDGDANQVPPDHLSHRVLVDEGAPIVHDADGQGGLEVDPTDGDKEGLEDLAQDSGDMDALPTASPWIQQDKPGPGMDADLPSGEEDLPAPLVDHVRQVAMSMEEEEFIGMSRGWEPEDHVGQPSDLPQEPPAGTSQGDDDGNSAHPGPYGDNPYVEEGCSDHQLDSDYQEAGDMLILADGHTLLDDDGNLRGDEEEEYEDNISEMVDGVAEQEEDGVF